MQAARHRSSSPRDPALDGLRGVAILLVFLFHYGGGLKAHNPLLRGFGYLTQAGWMGVNLFFALSGFLITGILAEGLLLRPADHCPPAPGANPPETTVSSAGARWRQPFLRNFYARRALRIFPLYYAALLACAVAALLAGAPPAQLRSIAIYGAFLQNLPPLVDRALKTPPPLPLFHLWSLAVEEQFYLLWPLLLIAARTPRRALRLSLWTFVLTALFRALLFAPHLVSFASGQTFATFLPTRAGALALGAALALYPRAVPCPRPPAPARAKLNVGLTAALLALTAILLTALHTHNLLLNNPVGYILTLPCADILAAALVALSLRANLLRRILTGAALSFLGRISYGFYVLHILLEPLFDRLGTLITHSHRGFAYQAVRLLVAFTITTAAAWLSFILLERPFLRLKPRFPTRQTPRAETSPPASKHA